MALTNEQAEELVDYMTSFSRLDIEFHESYSGRAMYGQEVGAITVSGDVGNLIQFGADLYRAIEELAMDVELPRRTDNLGYDTIVY